MEVFLIVLSVCFLLFLFMLYLFGRDDIVFIRRNISLEQLFDIAVLSAVVGLFTARLLYAVVSIDPSFLNPLVFLLVPYFPGLSLSGGIFGASVFILFYTRKKKMPTGRIFDYFALAMLAALPLGYFGAWSLRSTVSLFENIYLPFVYIILLVFFLKFIFPKIIRSDLRSGTLGMFFLLTFTFISLIVSLMNQNDRIFFYFSIEDVLSLFLFLASLAILIKQEVLVLPGKK